jgi:hypothetical protein
VVWSEGKRERKRTFQTRECVRGCYSETTLQEA